MGKRILAIVGSYRKGGIIDTAVSEVLAAAAEAGAEVEKVYLLDRQIGFCTNCRQCTQRPGIEPGVCVERDEMAPLIEAIERAEGLVLGAPVNFGNLNALTQRFLERLVCYAYWPWGQPAPVMRKQGQPSKPAVLITSSAMPAIMGRLFTGALRSLRKAAKVVGARPVATLFVGQAALDPKQPLSAGIMRKARRAGRRLAA